jgi:hypothetical protein
MICESGDDRGEGPEPLAKQPDACNAAGKGKASAIANA